MHLLTTLPLVQIDLHWDRELQNRGRFPVKLHRQHLFATYNDNQPQQGIIQ